VWEAGRAESAAAAGRPHAGERGVDLSCSSLPQLINDAGALVVLIHDTHGAEVVAFDAGVVGGVELRLGRDGALTLVDAAGASVWSAPTAGREFGTLAAAVDDGGALCVSDASGAIVWHSGGSVWAQASKAAADAADLAAQCVSVAKDAVGVVVGGAAGAVAGFARAAAAAASRAVSGAPADRAGPAV